MKMELLQGNGRRNASRWRSRGTNAAPGAREIGLAGWIWEIWNTLRANYLRGRLRSQARPAREMQVIELLGLGGRRQVALIRCGSERFLVGCGPEQVHTITRVSSANQPETALPMKDA